MSAVISKITVWQKDKNKVQYRGTLRGEQKP